MTIEQASELKPKDRVEIRLASCPKLTQKATVLKNPPALGKVPAGYGFHWLAIDCSAPDPGFGYVTIPAREILRKLNPPLTPPLKERTA